MIIQYDWVFSVLSPNIELVLRYASIYKYLDLKYLKIDRSREGCDIISDIVRHLIRLLVSM